MTLTMTIGGESITARETFPVINPATGEIHADAPNSSFHEVDDAMTSASSAVGHWSQDESVRRQALAACAARLLAATDELAQILTAEQGKPIAEATAEVQATAGWFAHFAQMPTPGEVLQDGIHSRVELRRGPLGVVVAITPWNYPLLLAGFKIAPALLAGNAVVLKPSPFTPLSSLRLGNILSEVLPAGVLNVLSGLDPLGALLVEHEKTSKISFTGSTATGRIIAESAGRHLKHATLELGGNDAAIVLDDVTPAAVVDRIFASAFANNGQTCIAIKRLYVPESLHEETVALLAERAQRAVVGDGGDPSTTLGPLNNARQRDIVARMVHDAAASGARVVTGGTAPDRPGYFFSPTIVTDIADDADLVAQEQFGPALPVLAYRDVSEALDRANNSEFGLGGSVWGADTERASEVATSLQCGTAWVNSHMVLTPGVPFTGAKTSGLGVENGLIGYQSFTQLQTHLVAAL
jgi:acyl-CoA reductase-like NAD-dependent aldehyde dehydrogenase